MSKPLKIILIRHGESQGNANREIYSKVPDYAIYLTEKGKEQAREVGVEINRMMGHGFSYGCYYSPYFRARQTMDEAIKKIGNNICYFQKEEIRIREQEYSGKLRNNRHYDELEREAYGKFFYRMENGESGADCFDRVASFLNTLYRDFDKSNFPNNVLIFAHGMINRIFLMKFLHLSVEEFEKIKNPRNGEMYILELQENGKYKLTSELLKHPKGYGYTYNP